MTTPERLRRRQRRESAGIAILAIALVVVVIYFRGQDSAQEKCLRNYIESSSATSKVRANVVERESKVTRRVISKSLTAESRRDIIRAREAYFRGLSAIDRVRDANPVQQLRGVCD